MFAFYALYWSAKKIRGMASKIPFIFDKLDLLRKSKPEMPNGFKHLENPQKKFVLNGPTTKCVWARPLRKNPFFETFSLSIIAIIIKHKLKYSLVVLGEGSEVYNNILYYLCINTFFLVRMQLFLIIVLILSRHK